jgi:hypothetical protein
MLDMIKNIICWHFDELNAVKLKVFELYENNFGIDYNCVHRN